MDLEQNTDGQGKETTSQDFVHMSDKVATEHEVCNMSDMLTKIIEVMLNGKEMSKNDIANALKISGDSNDLKSAICKAVALGILQKTNDVGIYKVARQVSKVFTSKRGKSRNKRGRKTKKKNDKTTKRGKNKKKNPCNNCEKGKCNCKPYCNC